MAKWLYSGSMSFKIDWGAIEGGEMTQYAGELLEEALNSGERPPVLCEPIKVTGLQFGEIPPTFQILEIGDLGVDRFRGIFSFKYYGDASVTVKTGVSASVLKNYNQPLGQFIKPQFVLSDCDFNVPLNLTLGGIKMSSIIIVVFSKTKGLTLVFKNDPLEAIKVTSSFDRIAPIANFLQAKIEAQIGEIFREFLPSLLYKLSLKYTQGTTGAHFPLSHEKKGGVLFQDIDPEHAFQVAPGSLMRLTRLASSRETLGVNPPIIKDCLTKGTPKSIKVNKVNKVELRGDIGGADLKIIKDIQSKASKGKGVTPHRRVIRMRGPPAYE